MKQTIEKLTNKKPGSKMMKVCPYCEQSYIWRVAIFNVDEIALMCDECDTVWAHDEEVIDGVGKGFEIFMTSRGKAADWKSVEWKGRFED